MLGAVCSLAAAMAAAAAGAYPERPVRLVVPYPPGGSADVLARVLAQTLAQREGINVVVENRPGGGTVIGARYVAAAPADGQTLLLGTVSSHAMMPALNADVGYDPVRDFTPVASLASIPFVLVARPALGVKDVQGLLALARETPGRISYASAGVGTSNHLAGELLDAQAGVRTMHVPYRGSAPALNGLLGDQVDVMFDLVPTAMPHLKTGALVALGSTGAERTSFLPEVPTLREQGLGDYDVTAWFGLFGPAGLAPDVVARWDGAVRAALLDPAVRTQLAGLGVAPDVRSSSEFADFVAQEWARWRGVVSHAGVVAAP
ncbi:tripartite tricarboxylate transporter substrate binding protein [Verticiella sediminum]|uniref:Tripartite tricarboxylate transporter substrate binding protein n=2 Tax=Verticiella sediminum TaxID=1247510 RepID=A0A556A8E2_9BURK|nr:tripartite tricarboxylate transporter substrate binding protein [Verticiella sediminum]